MNADLQRRALAAAVAVAADNGLVQDGATVIHSGSNVLVHLRPAPVIARVMTGTVALHDDPRRWLEREVSVLEFLAPSGIAVGPSPLIAAGPHQHDGLWMTFAQWIGDLAPADGLEDPRRLGRVLRELHDQLLTFEGELGDMRALRADITRLHGLLVVADGVHTRTIASLRARLKALDGAVFGSSLPTQALHGDVSLSNLLRTPERLVWNDFEDTFRGPVHWDVASLVISLRTRGADSQFTDKMLDSYGWDSGQDLGPFFAAHGVYDEIWRLYDSQRRRPASATEST